MHNDKIYFNIKEVAKLIGVTPTTIRNWEKNNLFVVKRNANNYRAFDLDSINILKKIKELSIDQHLNIPTIKNMLCHENLFPSSTITNDENTTINEYSKRLLSSKWKECREKMNLTLEEVSQKTGISSSYLSHIERCDANISLNILEKLSSFYGESIIFFYEDSEIETIVITKDERAPIDVGLPGVYIESLINNKNMTMRPAIYTILPESGDLQSHSHRGEEFIFVIDGVLKVTLKDSDELLLKQGDCISFKSTETHKWCNPSKRLTNILWVHSVVG